MDLNDEALVEEYRQTKDMSLFKSLVRRYQNRIYNAAFRMLGNREEAEEVVQDTFVKMHQNLDSFRKQSSFAAWAFKISHNLSIDRLRTKKRRASFQMFSFNPTSTLGSDSEDDKGMVIQQIPDEKSDPGKLIDLTEQSQVIQDSLNKLPESQRSVLVLFDIEGFSYNEVAEIVGVNIGTVRSRLYYGRLKLKEILTPYFSQTANPSN